MAAVPRLQRRLNVSTVFDGASALQGSTWEGEATCFGGRSGNVGQNKRQHELCSAAWTPAAQPPCWCRRRCRCPWHAATVHR